MSARTQRGSGSPPGAAREGTSETKSPETPAASALSGAPGEGAIERLLPLVYDELKKLAAHQLRRERLDHSLQPTALVHEVFLKLAAQRQVDELGRSHFLALGAQAMRRILVDHARRRRRSKRGGGATRMILDDDLAADRTLSRQRETDVLAVHDALERLAQLDSQQARIVEMRFFGGLSVQEVADVLGLSKRSVEAEWTMIRAWLRRELGGEDEA